MKILKNPNVCQHCKHLHSYFHGWKAFQCKLTKQLYTAVAAIELNCQNFVNKKNEEAK